MNTQQRRFLGIVTAALTTGTVSTLSLTSAAADPSPADRETARTLMDDGDRKLAAKDYDGALRSYRAAHKIMNVPTTALEVGKAEEVLGHLVEARDAYLAVARIAATPGEPSAFAKARAEAAQRAERIAPRIPSLTVEVSGPSDAIVVKIDGAVIPVEAIGLPRKVNPGKHAVVVTAPGFLPAKATVTLAEGEAHTSKVTLEPDESSSPVGRPVPVARSEGAFRSTPMLIAGSSMAAIGAAGLVGGIAWGNALYNSTREGEPGQEGPAVALAVASGVVAAAGVPLIIIGAQKAPAASKVSIVSIVSIVAPGYAGVRVVF